VQDGFLICGTDGPIRINRLSGFVWQSSLRWTSLISASVLNSANAADMIGCGCWVSAARGGMCSLPGGRAGVEVTTGREDSRDRRLL